VTSRRCNKRILGTSSRMALSKRREEICVHLRSSAAAFAVEVLRPSAAICGS
jgi:hypothetical protein